jgi:hypothetical protein
VVSSTLKDRKGMVAIGGLGASTNDMAAAGDHERNLLSLGRHGRRRHDGLGLALAQPDVPVVVITGDGEMLMGMGSLATVGMQKPATSPSSCWIMSAMARPAGRSATPPLPPTRRRGEGLRHCRQPGDYDHGGGRGAGS